MGTRKLSERRKEQQLKAGQEVQHDISVVKKLKEEGYPCSEIAKAIGKSESVVRILMSDDLETKGRVSN